jgi:hypothetical protein
MVLGVERSSTGVDSRLVRVMLVAYLVATGLGVTMRLVLAGVDVGIPFDHLLHSHSHTLYFGWAGLGVLTGSMGILAGPSRAMRMTAVALAVTLPLITVGFVTFGYHPVTIAVSTVVMLFWYLAAGLWWRGARHMSGTAIRSMRAGFVYLVIASFGVWVLAYLQASGRGTPLSETLAVHAFLIGFGWFVVFGLVGLVTFHAGRLGLVLDQAVADRVLRWWMPIAWVSFPLGVVGGPEVTGLGPAARLAGLLLLYPGWLWVGALWRAAPGGAQGRPWRTAAAWFAIASLTTGAVALFGTDALLVGGRQGVVIHLHALFVGFVTLMLVALVARRVPHRALDLHTVALAVMLAVLAVMTAGPVEYGLNIAAGAAVALWGAGLWWGLALWRETG